MRQDPENATPPGGGHLDFKREAVALRLGVLTISDSRTPADDKSGDLLVARLEAAGHRLAARALVRDEATQIEGQLRTWIAEPPIQVILTTGGTGLTARDITPEVVGALLEKRIDGFGEAFRHLSLAKVGTSALQSRALGGVAGRTLVFALPGSPGACRDAWDGILRWQLDNRFRPCNLVEILDRL